MGSQSAAAYSDYYHPSQSTANYYPMASSSYPPRSASVSSRDLNSLAHHFGQQSLRHDPRNVSTAYHTSTASGPYHQQVPQTHASSSSHHATHQSHQASSRSQRQSSSLPQCSAGHVQQLSSLVEHMVATGQCAVCNASITPQASSPESWEDETYGDEDDFEDEGFEEPPSVTARLTYRRSTDLSAGGQGYVSKAIRVRKKHRSDPSRLR